VDVPEDLAALRLCRKSSAGHRSSFPFPEGNVTRFSGLQMPDKSQIQLPKLRQLRCIKPPGDPWREADLYSILTALNLWAEAAPNLETVLYEGGTRALHDHKLADIPSLMHLPYLNAIRSQSSTILPFLKNNPQVAMYDNHTEYSMGDRFLRQHLGRLITSKALENLTSLSLEVDESFSKETLSYVGQLPQLERLLLDANHWHIRQDEVLAALEPLVNLRYLAFMRDVYVESFGGSEFAKPETQEDELRWGYYKPLNLGVSQEEVDRLELHLENMDVETVYDKVHHSRMHSIAEQYARTFPRLEWIFLGCHPFRISDGTVQSFSERRLLGTELFEHIFSVIKEDKVFRPFVVDTLYGSPGDKPKLSPECKMM
jgi:hypothetical protein